MKPLRWLLGLLSIVVSLLIIAPEVQNPVYAAPAESTAVWRAQITLHTCNVEDAGTDDDVKVELNANNSTWVDYARDDFEKNDIYTYDLVLDNVKKLEDITMLKISKTGSDAWCLKSFDLLINGKKIYEKDFGTAGKWIGNGQPKHYTISSATLRNHPSWKSYTQPFPPMLISRAEIESRIESIIGNYIHGTDVYWGHLHGKGVEAWKKDDQTVHFDLDLAKESWWFDPEVDIDFDIRFSCSEGKISLEVKNPSVDVDWDIAAHLFTQSIIALVSVDAAEKIEKSLKTITYSTSLGVPICPNITVQGNGDIKFSLF